MIRNTRIFRKILKQDLDIIHTNRNRSWIIRALEILSPLVFALLAIYLTASYSARKNIQITLAGEAYKEALYATNYLNEIRNQINIIHSWYIYTESLEAPRGNNKGPKDYSIAYWKTYNSLIERDVFYAIDSLASNYQKYKSESVRKQIARHASVMVLDITKNNDEFNHIGINQAVVSSITIGKLMTESPFLSIPELTDGSNIKPPKIEYNLSYKDKVEFFNILINTSYNYYKLEADSLEELIW